MILSIKSFVIALIVFTYPTFQSGNDLLKEVQEKYNSISDFTAQFKQAGNSDNALTGKFYYKSEDKFRIELQDRTLISDGETIWNYSPANKKVIISPVEDSGTSFSMNDYLYQYPKNCTVSYDEENGNEVIILEPKNSSVDFREVRLWISNDHLVKEIQMIDLMNNRLRVSLSNIKLNENLNDELFSFSPKKDTKVIDLR